MNDGWPGRWESAVGPTAVDDVDDDGPRYVNDHGTRYLIEDHVGGEWLMMWGDIPENTA